MSFLIKSVLTENEKKEMYQVRKQYYHKESYLKFEEWVNLTEKSYHENSKKRFQILHNKREILGYLTFATQEIENMSWKKVLEGGMSQNSSNKIKDFISMFSHLKKEKDNLIIEVGTKEQKIYYILTRYCGFKPFQQEHEEKVKGIMKSFLNKNNFEILNDEDKRLLIKRDTKYKKGYLGYLIFS